MHEGLVVSISRREMVQEELLVSEDCAATEKRDAVSFDVELEMERKEEGCQDRPFLFFFFF